MQVARVVHLLGSTIRIPGRFMYCLGEGGDAVSVLHVGRRDMQGQQLLERIHHDVDLRSLAPLSGVDCIVRLSSTTAVGSGSRPSANRRMARARE